MFSHILGIFLITCFNKSHHNQSEIESQWNFDLHFPDGYRYLIFFIYLLAICSSFEKVIQSDHLPNLIGLLILLMVLFFLILYAFWILIMLDISCKTFSPFCKLSLHSIVSFVLQILYVFIILHLSILIFVC
jgi:hypothetical protein